MIIENYKRVTIFFALPVLIALFFVGYYFYVNRDVDIKQPTPDKASVILPESSGSPSKLKPINSQFISSMSIDSVVKEEK